MLILLSRLQIRNYSLIDENDDKENLSRTSIVLFNRHLKKKTNNITTKKIWTKRQNTTIMKATTIQTTIARKLSTTAVQKQNRLNPKKKINAKKEAKVKQKNRLKKPTLS